MNTYDWISTLDIHDPMQFDLVEVSFKKGARKDFFINDGLTYASTGDMVVVGTESGNDVGKITLSGELVRVQMKKKKVNPDRITNKVIRRANSRDLEKLAEARSLEKETLVRCRVISRTLGLDMKIGDIEFQGDKRKATIYYTAEGRIDFRELVRSYVKEFKVKIEMRQIGARQESARIGGIGSCGRELCCSTWLSDFKSVSTSAARYQNIAINQAKLSGQCGRLKCCLNYELDTYMDALKAFPKKADYIKTKKGKAALIKTDIFKGLMFYVYIDLPSRGPVVTLDKERVKEIQKMNAEGQYPDDLIDHTALLAMADEEEPEVGYADVTGQIELPMEKKTKGRNNRRKKKPNQGSSGSKGRSNRKEGSEKSERPARGPSGEKGEAGADRKPRRSNRNRGRNSNRKTGGDNGGKPQSDNKGPQGDK